MPTNQDLQARSKRGLHATKLLQQHYNSRMITACMILVSPFLTLVTKHLIAQELRTKSMPYHCAS